MYNQQHPELSTKYQLLTLDAIDAHLLTMGYERHRIQQRKSRPSTVGGQRFGAYVARYRPIGADTKGYEGPEVVVFNSNDGTRALRVHVGYFRMVCSNGLILGQTVFRTGRMVHVGTGFRSTIESAFAHIGDIVSTTNRFKLKLESITLNEDAINTLYTQAAMIRDDKFNPAKDLLSPLIPQRAEDTTPTAWNVFNMIQEAMLNGLYRINAGKKKRPLSNPLEIMRVNTSISELFESMV